MAGNAEKIVLVIAMPTLGQVATPAVKSLLAITQDLARRGVPFAFDTYEFSDVVFSRNQLMSRFLTNDRFTHMLCLDSDMAYEPKAIWRLLEFGVDFAATAYPQKKPNWSRLRSLVEAEAGLPEEQKSSMETLLSRTWRYNHQLAGFGGHRWTPKRRNGFITVPATGTGMMLLSRRVPELMAETGVATAKPQMSSVPLHEGLKYHDFFGHLDSPNGGLMYGEDQSFCMRWTNHCDGEIWLDTESKIVHYGEKAFPGTYIEQVADDFSEIDDA